MDRLRQDIAALKGRRTGLSYRDLEGVLLRYGFSVTGRGTSHRTFSHPELEDHWTLIDSGRGDVLPVYIQKTRKALIALLENS